MLFNHLQIRSPRLAACFIEGEKADYQGEAMKVGPVLRLSCRMLSAIATMALAGAPALKAQVGLSSAASPVVLTARVALRASFEARGPGSETASSDGSANEMSLKVRVSANAGYRLVVVGTAPATAARLWVRDTGGEFRSLTQGSEVIVIRDPGTAGEELAEVRYRAGALEPVGKRAELPVRYEVRVEPTI